MKDKTYLELSNQYEALQKTFHYLMGRREEIKVFFKKNVKKSLIYTGCGSGWCLCQSAAINASVRLGIPAYALTAGDLILNLDTYQKMIEGTVLVAPSRSGSTTEVIRAVDAVRAAGNVPVLAITCVVASDLSKKADLVLELPWAFDESVCQTRSVSNLYAANLIITALVQNDQKLLDDLQNVIEQGEAYLAKIETSLRDIARQDWTDIVILADAELQGIASEGAIAFTEIAQIAGRYYHVLDVRHGPMVLVNQKSLVIVHLHNRHFHLQKQLVEDLLKRGASVIVYSNEDVEEIKGVSLQISSGRALDMAVSGIPFVNIAQLLAYFKAHSKGINPDNPDGIVAWVKLS